MLVSVSKVAKHALAQHFLGHLGSVFLRGVVVWMLSCCLWISCGSAWVSYQDQFTAELKSVLFINSKLGVKKWCN